MGERRTTFEIYSDILWKCMVSKLKTEIVYQCNLNFSTINGYLNFLMSKKMIRQNGKYYETTEHGKESLHSLDEALDTFRLLGMIE